MTSSTASNESRISASSRASGRTRSRRTARAPAMASTRPSRTGRLLARPEIAAHDRVSAERREHLRRGGAGTGHRSIDHLGTELALQGLELARDPVHVPLLVLDHGEQGLADAQVDAGHRGLALTG